MPTESAVSRFRALPDGPAVLGLHKGMNEKAHYGHAKEAVEEAGVLGYVLQAGRTIGEVEAQYAVDVQKYHADYLAKAEGDYGKIVAFEAQRWDTYQMPNMPGTRPRVFMPRGLASA